MLYKKIKNKLIDRFVLILILFIVIIILYISTLLHSDNFPIMEVFLYVAGITASFQLGMFINQNLKKYKEGVVIWQNINKEQPKEGEIVLIYCPELNFPYDIMYYDPNPVVYYNSKYQEKKLITIGRDCFYNKSGYIVDDVTHFARLY